ncbi:MAG: hypothetical protein LBG52_00970 [Candidatus Peribacteria bacterium]|nr:hypothetical protein [Candidatus Peribacteria bacterium]
MFFSGRSCIGKIARIHKKLYIMVSASFDLLYCLKIAKVEMSSVMKQKMKQFFFPFTLGELDTSHYIEKFLRSKKMFPYQKRSHTH